MQNKWLWALAAGLLIGATGCPDVQTDDNEVGTAGPVVEFDPANRIVPFPNNLLLDPATGRVNVPPSCDESPASMATRTMVLNQLDGFGTYQVAMSVTFSAPVDPATLEGNVVLYQRIAGMTPVIDGMAIPVITIPGMSVRQIPSAADPTVCESTVLVDSLTIVPMVPLEQKSFYTVGLLAGLQTAGGEAFTPSFTWALIRQAENPVTLADPACNSGTGTCAIASERTPLDPTTEAGLASLNGIHRLWTAHAGAVELLVGKGHAREDLLLAWEFKTQTVTDPLDPAVPTSPAADVTSTPLLGVQSITCTLDATTCPRGINRTLPSPYGLCPPAEDGTQCFLKIALGAASGATGADVYTTGNAICTSSVPCAAVGDIVAGAVSSKQYQLDTPNPFDATRPIPGPWGDPIAPTKVKDSLLEVLAMVPATAVPAAGHPTLVFGHGLGSSKKTLVAIGPQLAAQGYLSVAIDFVGHDSRAVRISDTGDCADAGTPAAPPDPTAKPQCFAPFLSPNLGATRDGIRQSVLDVLGLIAGLEACGTSMCTSIVPEFQVNPASIEYLGISLGGIIGSVITAVSPDIRAAVLNVAGVGWADIFENTETLAIRCSLVDGLIDAGILMGDKSTGAMPLCATDAWKMQAGYRQFSAIARWVLDPADPANFTRMLAGKRFLLQKVVGDLVVPNIATDREAALTGLTAQPADPQVSTTPAPSAAITTMPMSNKFVEYMDLPPDPGTGFPGNTFSHSSLLRPAPSVGGGTCNPGTGADCDGVLGTIRVQTDAITYLVLNR